MGILGFLAGLVASIFLVLFVVMTIGFLFGLMTKNLLSGSGD